MEKIIIGKNANIKIVTNEELRKILLFQKEVIDFMENKEWFKPLTEEEFLEPINHNDNVYIIMYNDIMIGLLVLLYNLPGVLKEYKLPSLNYMLIDSIMVKKEYRGHKLQKQMLNFAEKRALDLKLDGLVATVHPDNKYSINNFINEDYEISHTLNIHGGIRNIMVKTCKK